MNIDPEARSNIDTATILTSAGLTAGLYALVSESRDIGKDNYHLAQQSAVDNEIISKMMVLNAKQQLRTLEKILEILQSIDEKIK